jgi:hypothetical protein
MTEFNVDSDEWGGYPFTGIKPTEERMQGMHVAVDVVLANRRKHGGIINAQGAQFDDALEANPDANIYELAERIFTPPVSE